MTPAGADWIVEWHRADADTLHHLAEPPVSRRTARVMEVERPALVLGSSQRDDVVDDGAVARAGVQVVRRRSGGGAVLVAPGAQAWIDLLVPADDPLWDDDVSKAAWWAGDTWRTAMDALGFGPGRVHRGGLVRTEWSRLICFTGVGPGEVTVADRKLVGLSQRRSRRWTRIQTTAMTSWEPGMLVELLKLSGPQREQARRALDEAAGPAGTDPDGLIGRVLESLPA